MKAWIKVRKPKIVFRKSTIKKSLIKISNLNQDLLIRKDQEKKIINNNHKNKNLSKKLVQKKERRNKSKNKKQRGDLGKKKANIKMKLSRSIASWMRKIAKRTAKYYKLRKAKKKCKNLT